jgi:hypothetical protein
MVLTLVILSVALVFLAPVVAAGFLAARLSTRDPRRQPAERQPQARP